MVKVSFNRSDNEEVSNLCRLQKSPVKLRLILSNINRDIVTDHHWPRLRHWQDVMEDGN